MVGEYIGRGISRGDWSVAVVGVSFAVYLLL